MDNKDDRYDNARIEIINGLYKAELIQLSQQAVPP